MTGQAFISAMALAGMVIIVSALLSGLVQRSGVPQVLIFLAMGAAVGPSGLGAIDIGLDSAVLRVIATLSLALVLFTDAVGLNVRELRKNAPLAIRVVGPGTGLSAVVVGLMAWALLGLTPVQSAILGAALASTDPVLLRGLLGRDDVPINARQALQLESGLNDVVLLPIVLVAMRLLGPAHDDHEIASRLFVQLFVLGPGAGVAIGLLGVAALDMVRRKVGVRRDYESLYSLGIAFTAFAAAEYFHGSGFLAAFAAGVTIAALDVELCDCFVEYGGVTAEMLLLFTFVLFGCSLIWSAFGIMGWRTVLFAVLVLVLRVPVYMLSLWRSGVDHHSRWLIAWFGPRGLSSLLLVLLPIFEGLPGAQQLFPICCLVVLLSVVVHGCSPLFLRRIEISTAAPVATGAATLMPADIGAAAPAPSAAAATPPPAPTSSAAASTRPAAPTLVDTGSSVAPSDAAEPGAGTACDWVPSASGSIRNIAPVPAAESERNPVPAAESDRNPAPAAESDRSPAPAAGLIRETDPASRVTPAAPLADAEAAIPRTTITMDQFNALRASGAPLVLLDARRPRGRAESDIQAAGSVRMHPDHVLMESKALDPPKDAWIVVYCACVDEATSGRVSQELRQLGWTKARALVGGFAELQKAGWPMEPKVETGRLAEI